MRTIFLLRGAPGSGKSTWVAENKLEPYALSADNIRQMFGGLIYTPDGNPVIPQDKDAAVWDELMERLEERMDRGEFVIVDATHYKASLLQRYKKLIGKYRYRAYVVNFSEVTLEECLRRNAAREVYKHVPEDAIRKMYAVFASGYKEVSTKFKVLTPDEATALLKQDMLYDYNHYKEIAVFGDIHGCYTPLAAYFDENPFSDDTAYIFVGDYLDRGIQNKEVLEFLISIRDKKNVLLLEGNHERWLRMYSEGYNVEIPPEEKVVLDKYVDKSFWRKYSMTKIRNSGFIKYTVPQIESVSKKEIKKLCQRFGQMAYISFHGKEYFITHGGVPVIPNIFIPTGQLIDGTGKYEDVDTLYDAWMNNTSENAILVHGHRNIFEYPAKTRERCYNLCSGVEYGKSLRVMTISDTGIGIKEYEVTVYDKNLKSHATKEEVKLPASENEVVAQLNESPLVEKKVFPNGVVSYNFTRKAFYDALWNDLTCTARGLFMKGDKVVARSYNKFFNWGEVLATSTRGLHENLKFPVVAYHKENGFLGMASAFDGELMVCSKSSIQSPFSTLARNTLHQYGEETVNAMYEYSLANDCTFVFECIDTKNDPHIIPDDKPPHIVLLDIMKNDLTGTKLPYEELVKVAAGIGIPYKKVDRVFKDWHELYTAIKTMNETLDPYNEDLWEGWVLEDTNGFMFKVKTGNYRWWKSNRSVMDSLRAGHTVKPIYRNEADVKLFALMSRLLNEGKLPSMSILDVQKVFWSEHTLKSKE